MDASHLFEPEWHHLYGRVSTFEKSSIWVQLPEACWQATGGDIASGSLITLAFTTGTVAVKILDDVQDRHIVPELSNDGLALAFLVTQILALLPRENLFQIRRLQDTYTATILRMCAGQHLDLHAKSDAVHILDRSWATANRKTAEWFAWGASLYPKYVGDESTEHLLVEFGTHLGMMHQIANDLRGFMDTSDTGDLRAQKISIPIAYLLTVLPQSPLASQFALLWQKAAQEQSAREEIVAIAYNGGVVPYLKLMSEYHAQQALDLIHTIFPELIFLVEHPNVNLPHPQGVGLLRIRTDARKSSGKNIQSGIEVTIQLQPTSLVEHPNVNLPHPQGVGFLRIRTDARKSSGKNIQSSIEVTIQLQPTSITPMYSFAKYFFHPVTTT